MPKISSSSLTSNLLDGDVLNVSNVKYSIKPFKKINLIYGPDVDLEKTFRFSD